MILDINNAKKKKKKTLEKIIVQTFSRRTVGQKKISKKLLQKFIIENFFYLI